MDRLINVLKSILITEVSESFASNPVVLKELTPVDFRVFLLPFFKL